MKIKRNIIVLAAIVVVLISSISYANEAKDIGTSFGNLLELYPGFYVIAHDSVILVGSAGNNFIYQKGQHKSEYITEIKAVQLDSLSKYAREFALNVKAPFYGVSNISIHSIASNSEVIVQTTADILALGKKQK